MVNKIRIENDCVILNDEVIYILDNEHPIYEQEALNLIEIGYNIKPGIFKVETLDDQMKLEFIQKIFDKFSCSELEALIKH